MFHPMEISTKHPIAEVWGRRIRERRGEIGLTSDALADKVGVSQSSISRYESGDRRPYNVELMQQIADALECDMVELFAW